MAKDKALTAKSSIGAWLKHPVGGPILRDLLAQHVEQTESALAADFLARFDEEVANFVRVVPRDYAAVLRTRQEAVDEGLDPDGDVVWTRILEVTGG